jgi:hypothetical protein
MARRDDMDEQPELISLARACRRAGISVQTATRLPREEWPFGWTWLGGKRVVPRRRFEQWLAEKIDAAPAA